jgi:hypothetical protein
MANSCPTRGFFPNGFASLAAQLGARGFSLAGYTDRGVKQCDPSPGSKGFEASDAAQFVAWNINFVDCYSSLDYATGMSDYKLFGDALRRGNPGIYYLICGCKLGEGRSVEWANVLGMHPNLQMRGESRAMITHGEMCLRMQTGMQV